MDFGAASGSKRKAKQNHIISGECMQPCQDRTAEFRERRLGRRRRPRHPRATHRRPRLCRHHFRAPATAGPHRSGCWTRHTRVSLFLMRANDDCVLFAKSKSKGVYIYSGNSTILVLDNRRWGAGSTSTSIRPGSAKLTSAWQYVAHRSSLIHQSHIRLFPTQSYGL